jgi:hypothetical protein
MLPGVQKRKRKEIGGGKRYHLVIADAGQHQFRCLSTKQKKVEQTNLG